MAGKASDTAKIEFLIRDALNELLTRAAENSLHEIVDEKGILQGNKPNGVLQDCEFGFILIFARSWLKERGAIGPANDNPIAEDGTVQELVVELIDRVLTRLTIRDQNRDKGGEMEGALSFFSAEPYSYHNDKRRRQVVLQQWSANLDAAMIAFSFFALATENYDEILQSRQLSPKLRETFSHSENSKWVRNLRDAALYVCGESLAYAERCRAIKEDKFVGFSCDPSSVKYSDDPEDFPDDESRLFFTWTACESISDAVRWGKAYLKGLKSSEALESVGVPPGFVKGCFDKIEALEKDLKRSAIWCKETFAPTFNQLGEEEDQKNVTAFVKKASDALKGTPGLSFPPEMQDESNDVGDYVQNVYRVSQYIAVRSLVSGQVTFSEAETMVELLDRIVMQKIIGSGLDTSNLQVIGELLTCSYSLGASNSGGYRDDAYYPLVVRSLSGLLCRTIEDFKRKDARKLTQLISSFKRILAGHYDNLVARRPGEDKDQALWSFASGLEYVFYATQRTVFALISYATFLDVVTASGQQDEVEVFATTFGRALLQKFAEEPFRDQLLQFLGPDLSPEDAMPGNSNSLAASLPREPWVATAIQGWLDDFLKQAKTPSVQLFKKLRAGAEDLSWLQKNKDSTETLATKGRNNPNEREIFYETIIELPGIGPRLKSLPEWDKEQILPILLEAAFSDYLRNKEKNLGAMLNSRVTTDLWGCLYKVVSLKADKSEQKI